jgi:MFS transporter, PPP family, 3-phenylpropionic acid transporter
MSRSDAQPEPAGAGALAVFYFASFGALGLHAPYFPLWLEAHGFRGVSMGVIAALSPALSLFGPPLIGLLSDARGARGSLLGAACALSASAMAGLCAAELFGSSRSFGVVFAAMLIYSACRSPLILLADRIAIEHGGNYGRQRLWGSVGYLLAVAAFGRWCPPGAWRWLPGMVALALLAAFVVSLPLPRVRAAALSPPLTQARRLLGRPSFVVFLICSATFAASHSSYDLCGSLFFRDLGASGNTLGLLYATGVVAEIGLMAWGSASLRRVSPELLLACSYAGGALRWLLMSLLGSTELAFLLQPMHAISFGLVWLSSLEYVRRSSEPHTLGGAQGAFMAANALGGVLGLLIWGPLYASRGGALVFLFAAGLSVCAAALAYGALYRHARARTARGPTALIPS